MGSIAVMPTVTVDGYSAYAWSSSKGDQGTYYGPTAHLLTDEDIDVRVVFGPAMFGGGASRKDFTVEVVGGDAFVKFNHEFCYTDSDSPFVLASHRHEDNMTTYLYSDLWEGDEEEQVTVQIVPQPGYVFVGWEWGADTLPTTSVLASSGPRVSLRLDTSSPYRVRAVVRKAKETRQLRIWRNPDVGHVFFITPGIRSSSHVDSYFGEYAGAYRDEDYAYAFYLEDEAPKVMAWARCPTEPFEAFVDMETAATIATTETANIPVTDTSASPSPLGWAGRRVKALFNSASEQGHVMARRVSEPVEDEAFEIPGIKAVEFFDAGSTFFFTCDSSNSVSLAWEYRSPMGNTTTGAGSSFSKLLDPNEEGNASVLFWDDVNSDGYREAYEPAHAEANILVRKRKAHLLRVGVTDEAATTRPFSTISPWQTTIPQCWGNSEDLLNRKDTPEDARACIDIVVVAVDHLQQSTSRPDPVVDGLNHRRLFYDSNDPYDIYYLTDVGKVKHHTADGITDMGISGRKTGGKILIRSAAAVLDEGVIEAHELGHRCGLSHTSGIPWVDSEANPAIKHYVMFEYSGNSYGSYVLKAHEAEAYFLHGQ